MSPWPPGVAADALAPGMLVAATLMLAPAALVTGLSSALPPAEPVPMLLIATQSAVFSGQFLLLFVLQKAGGPVLLSLLGAVGAVVGVPVAVFLLGEAPPAGLLPGTLLIGTGVVLLIRPMASPAGDILNRDRRASWPSPPEKHCSPG